MKKFILYIILILIGAPFMWGLSFKEKDSLYKYINIIGIVDLDKDNYIVIYTNGNKHILLKNEYLKYRDSVGYSFANNKSCFIIQWPSSMYPIVDNDSALYGYISFKDYLKIDSMQDKIRYLSFSKRWPDYFVLGVVPDSVYNILFSRIDADFKRNWAEIISSRKDRNVRILFPVFLKNEDSDE